MIFKASYRTVGRRWEGVVKNEAGEIVWTCGHHHKNRDYGREDYGGSAMGCARVRLTELGKGDDSEGFIKGRAKWGPLNTLVLSDGR